MKQNRETDQLILNKSTKAIKKSKDSLLIMVLTQFYIHMQQGELQSITHTIYQKLIQYGLYIYM